MTTGETWANTAGPGFTLDTFKKAAQEIQGGQLQWEPDIEVVPPRVLLPRWMVEDWGVFPDPTAGFQWVQKFNMHAWELLPVLP
jgi:hypothetical protein